MNSTFTKVDTHSLAWARVQASFWGMSPDHDLDEPVQLTDEVPVRMRFHRQRGSVQIIIDRETAFKVTRSGYHALMRFKFKDASFIEHEIPGVHSLDISISTVQVSPQ